MKKFLSLSAIGGVSAFFWVFVFATPAGFVVATFTYSKGYSYLSDDPKACVNCHVMKDHFYSYEKSSHHHVAVCNSCHTPQGIIPKYITKAINGWNHGLAFTTGKHPWPLQMTKLNKKIANTSCLKCHDSLVNHFKSTEQTNCIHCHSNVGHIR
ncbi:MAG: cytochrome c nitrite reductase small subunit [Bacteriovoracaceae bacterium]|jgi:cytochrome c nitrite reductase small subunit